MGNNKNIFLQYAGKEYLLTPEYGSFLELKDLLIDDPWWFENQDTSLGIGGPDLLAKKVITNVGADWFHSSNDLSYDNYYSTYGGGKDLPIFAALSLPTINLQSTLGVIWDSRYGYAVGDNAKLNASHYYLNATLIGNIGSFNSSEEDKVFHVNSKPKGTPTIEGEFKIGSTLTVNTSNIQDAVNKK